MRDKQKELLIKIMEADEESGLYDTPVGMGATKRHPSEITLEEFIEVAKMMHPMSFAGNHDWRMIDTAIEGVENAYRLVADTSLHHFHIDWDNDLSFDYYDNYCEELQYPTFARSIKIAQYLDQIGIEYKAEER